MPMNVAFSNEQFFECLASGWKSPTPTAMLPEIVGTLAMLAGRAMKIIDPDVKNPDTAMWEGVLGLMELLL